MGGNESKKSEPKNKNVAAPSEPTRGNVQSKVKHVLLLYKADAKDKQQLDLVDAFQRALVNAGLPHIDVEYKVNISQVEPSSIQDLDQWLDQVNSVILIRLSTDILADLERIIRDKHFVDNGGVLHDKILGVSFGKDIPAGWPPKEMERRTRAKKDFCFGFEDESALSRKDFKSDSAKKTLNSIVTALMEVHRDEA